MADRVAQKRAWYVAHIEKVRKYRRAYYKRNRTHLLEKRRENIAKNKEKHIAYAREYKAKNAHKIKEQNRIWYLNNRTKMLSYQRKNYRKIKKKMRAQGLTTEGKRPLTGWQKRRIWQQNARRNLVTSPEEKSKLVRAYVKTLTPEQRYERIRPAIEASAKKRAAHRKARELFGPNYRQILSS